MKFKAISIDTLPLFDTHVHAVPHGPDMANYTTGSVKSCIDHCAKIGMKVMCLTDHAPLPPEKIDPTKDRDCAIPKRVFLEVLSNGRSELKNYAGEKNITLYIGGEFDFFADCQKFYDDFDKTFNPEFKVLGQHFIDTVDVYPDKNGLDCYGEKIMKTTTKDFCFDFSESAFAFGIQEKGANLLVERYFELLETALTAQNYDTVAHIDLINKYNEDSLYFTQGDTYRKRIERILQCMLNKHVALEINLSAASALNRLVPGDWIIKKAAAYQIPITFGSDAHGLENSVKEQQQIKEMLKEIGIRTISVPVQIM